MLHSGTVLSDVHGITPFSELSGIGTIIVPILQPRKLRIREIEFLIQSHI